MYSTESQAERIAKLEKKMYEEIVKFINKNNQPPTVRELRKLLEIRSTSTTLEYLRRLKEKGLIDWKPKQPRTLKVLKR